MSTSNKAALATSETIETLNRRLSIRQYTDEPLEDEMLLAILNAARRTSTSSNMQTYSFVVVRDADKKRALSQLAGSQQHIVDCAAFVAVCADLTRVAGAVEIQDGKLAGGLELSMVSIVDAALAGQSLALAAESLGLGIVMIGGMRNQPDDVAQLLALPEGVFVLFGVCIGWPAAREDIPLKPRFPAENIIHFEEYTPANAQSLADYDTALAEYYRAQGRVSPDAAWTGILGQRLQQRQRPTLNKTLTRRGFNFE